MCVCVRVCLRVCVCVYRAARLGEEVGDGKEGARARDGHIHQPSLLLQLRPLHLPLCVVRRVRCLIRVEHCV